MSYQLGTETEAMAFVADGIEYAPAGLAHAVDAESPVNGASAVLGYAICGKAVRVWPDQAFDSAASGAHDECASITRRD